MKRHNVLPDKVANSVSYQFRFVIKENWREIVIAMGFIVVFQSIIFSAPDYSFINPWAPLLHLFCAFILLFIVVYSLKALVDLEPIHAQGLVALNDWAQESHTVANLVEEGLLPGHTLRYRDFYAAEEIIQVERQQREHEERLKRQESALKDLAATVRQSKERTQ